ncbi:MAG TPA: IPT/TIG domain-containing protein [Vicinamibacterales bacterium]
MGAPLRGTSGAFWIRTLLTRASFLALLLAGALAVTSAQTQPVRYVYDELGRLVAVIDQSGAAAIYHYDAVGNLLSITRQNAGVVSIFGFSPDSSSVGGTVTLYGTGFSATSSQNTVTFNGVTATVTSSTTTHIVTSVPAGASTGYIAVTTPGGNAISPAPFTVTASSAPTISGVSPASGVAGTSVTVSGTNFDTVANRNRLLFNASPAVISSATGTSLTATVPPSATSGKVSVATLGGSAVSTSDFIVVPPPYGVSDVLLTDRMTPGTSKVVTIGSANKIALIMFDGVAGQRVSLKVGTGMTSGVTLLNYNHTALGGVTVGAVEAFIDTVTLTATATYTIVVDPVGSATGSITLTLYDVPADVTDAVTADGTPETVTNTTPGQNGRLTFSGTVGQRVSVKVGAGPVGTVSLVGPDRAVIASVSIPIFGVALIDTQTLALAGTYSVIVDYSTKNVGSVPVTVYTVPADISDTITAGGSSVAVSPGIPGQNAALTFSGTGGQRVSVYISGVSMVASVSVRNSGGTALGSATVTALPGFIEPVTLPSTGTYTVFVDPTNAATGSVTLNLYDVAADTSGALTVGGAAVNVSLGSPGQIGSLTFSGTSGQQITVNVTNSDFRTPVNTVSTVVVRLLKPDGTVLTSQTSSGSTFSLTTQTLPVTGTYTVIVDPSQANTGSLSINLTNP